MKIFFALIFTALLLQLGIAQEKCMLKGMVLDSIQIPVYDASITAFDQDNQSAGFTFTDKEGQFSLEMDCGKKYELEVEHIQYEPKVHTVNLDKSKREKIVLKSSSIQLKDIVAKGRIPIKMKGDTIEYDADSFKTGNEEDLEDILKKLPGIQVEDGKVFYQGKQINSIKVEGREIFGGNTKLLTKNLPSDAVDKIQLNQKFKANPFANSLQDEEQPELNIVLKEDKKNLIFGNVTVGGDAHKHYDLQEKIFRFSRKTDATLISDFNTYGKEVFTPEDYFQFLGGISEFTEEGGSIALRNSMGNIMFGSGNKATDMSNHLGAFHFGYEPKDKLNITAFALATDNDLSYKSTTERIYSDFTQRDEKVNDQNIFSFISRLKLDYTVGKKSNIKYRVNFNVQDQDNSTDINTFTNNETQPSIFRDTKSKRENTNLSQRLSYITKVGTDDNFGIYLTHSYQKENPELLLSSTQEPFSGFFSFTPINSVYALNQKEELKSNTIQGLAVYNHLITNLSNIRIKLGTNYSNQKVENRIFDNETLIDTEFTPSMVDFNFTEYYADATYTRKIDKFKFNVGTGLHHYKTKNESNLSNSELNLTRLLPHIDGEYNFNMSNKVRFSYKQTFEIPQVRELTDGYDVTSYFSIFRGNPNLRETRFHQSNLSYSLYNYYKFFNLYVSANYSKKLDNIRTKGFFDEQINFSTPFNSSEPEDIWSFNFYMSKRFSKIYSLKLNGNLNFSKFGSKSRAINNTEINLINNSNTYSATLTNTFKIRKKVEIDAGLRFINSNYKNQLNENEFTTWTPFLKGAFVLSESLLLQANYEFRDQFSNGENINKNHDLNAYLRFKPAKRIYLYFKVGNILDNDKIVSNGFNDFYTTFSSQEVLGRYFVASVKYKF